MSTIALAVSIALDELEEAAPAAAPPPAPPEPAVAAPPPPRPAASFGASLAATLGYGILGLRRPRSPLPARR